MTKSEEKQLWQRLAALEAAVKEFLGELRTMREVDVHVRELAEGCFAFVDDAE